MKSFSINPGRILIIKTNFMKKLYTILFVLVPLMMLGQDHDHSQCSHHGERGAVNSKMLENPSHYFENHSNEQSFSNAAIPYINDFANGFGDFDFAINGEGTLTWFINNSHFSNDAQTAAGNLNYLQHDDWNDGAQENWAITPTFDLSQAESPVVSFWEHVHWPTYADCDNPVATGLGNGCQEVMYSTNYTGDINTSDWTVIYNDTFDNQNPNESVPTNAWGDQLFALPAEASVTVAFVYSGNFASDWLLDDVRVFDEAAINLFAAASVSEDDVTFSFEVDNFVVGNGDGADGHIHYSLNGGAEVMIYSDENLTLNDLPNGTHTIVFSLVDVNHQPLDPPVEIEVTFTTFDGVFACDVNGELTYDIADSGGTTFDQDFTGPDPSELQFTVTPDEGETLTMVIGGSTESGWDWIYVTDADGNILHGPATGAQDVTITSETAVSVYIAADGSIVSTVTFDITCEAVISTVDVTFTVNTANVTGGVGEGGMYLGGGVFGGANAHAMQDDDGDGTWEVTVTVDSGTEGAYTFVNSPANGDDYAGKEDISGQECAYGEWNDRFFGPVTEDTTLMHCYGSCETDGTCPAPPSTTMVTFNVNMNAYAGEFTTVHVKGEFNGWSEDGYVMNDDDGDGIYTHTEELAHGTYFWKYSIDQWAGQESFSSESEGCTAENNGNFDRQITVEGESMDVAYCWNSCSAEGCNSALQLKGILDIDVGGGVGKGVHLYAVSDIADLSLYGLGSANNQQGTDGLEFALSGSVSAGQHILVTNSAADATGDDVFLDGYLGASEAFDLIINGGGSALQGNGNDAYELFEVIDGNEVVVETFGVTGNVGDPSQGGDYTMDWVYRDSWAYKDAFGIWTYGGESCTDGSTTTCESNCPYPFISCDTSSEVVDFLVNGGNWRVMAEENGHMGVGPGDQFSAAWWNADAWAKAYTGLYDDGWMFDAEGFMTHDTGDDGTIFGKKPAIDAAFPENTPYDADIDPDTGNADNQEYFNYPLATYTDSYSVSTLGDYDTITLGSNGAIGFYTATAGQEYQILETGEGYMYLRNVGQDTNSWYGKFTNADYLSTSDNEILDMRIYPNPVNGNYITILTPVEGLKDVEVYSVTGRKLLDTTINNNTLDVSSLNSGFYMIKVTIDGQSKVSKLIVR